MFPVLPITFWMLGIFILATTKLNPTLPLMQNSFLAIIHALFIGGTLLPVLTNQIPKGTNKSLGTSLITIGLSVLIFGFMAGTRTALPLDGGIFISMGLLLFLPYLLKKPQGPVFLPSIALIQTCVLGCILGKNLNRSTIDPIPFTLLSIHALSGIFLSLIPLVFFLKNNKENEKHPIIVSIIFTFGLLLSYLMLRMKYPSTTAIRVIISTSGLGLIFFLIHKKDIILSFVMFLIFIVMLLSPAILNQGSDIVFISLGLAFGLVLFSSDYHIKQLSLVGFLLMICGLIYFKERWIQLGAYIQAGSILMNLLRYLRKGSLVL